MILDAADLPDNPGITALEISSLVFHLTGSRYIGGAHNHSDWDFVVQDADTVESFLLGAGFRPSPRFNKNPGKNDGYTLEVYEYSWGPVRIQVQVTQHLNAKLYARDLIKNHTQLFYDHYMSTTKERIELWKAICTEFLDLGTYVYVAKPAKSWILQGVDFANAVASATKVVDLSPSNSSSTVFVYSNSDW